MQEFPATAYLLAAPPHQRFQQTKLGRGQLHLASPLASLCGGPDPSPDRQSAARGPRTGCASGIVPASARAVHEKKTASIQRRRPPVPGTSPALASPHVPSTPAPKWRCTAAAAQPALPYRPSAAGPDPESSLQDGTWLHSQAPIRHHPPPSPRGHRASALVPENAVARNRPQLSTIAQ